MNTLHKLPLNDVYQNLDSVQKKYIDILKSEKASPVDVEDSLVNFFQYSTDRMLTPTSICDTLSVLIGNQRLLSNAVIKMAKNRDGITNFIIDLQNKPNFMNDDAWDTLKGRKVANQTGLLKRAMTV